MTEYVDFKTIREEFTKCKVSNGQILKTKNVLVAIKKVPHAESDNGLTPVQFATKIVSFVETPVDIDASSLE